MIPWLPWGILTVLTGWIAWTDAWHRRIPNRASLWATALGTALMIVGVIPWTHLWWAAGLGLTLELADLVEHGRLQSGDIKWSVITMGWLGAHGLWVMAFAQIVALIWATVSWGMRHRTTRWSQAQAPWGPGFLIGLLALAGDWWWVHG